MESVRLLENRAGAVFEYDDDEAKGRVEILRGPYGPTLVVNGREIAYIDLFPASRNGDGGPVQLLVFEEERCCEPLCKINLFENGRLVVIVNEDAERMTSAAIRAAGVTPIHLGTLDKVYSFPDPNPVG